MKKLATQGLDAFSIFTVRDVVLHALITWILYRVMSLVEWMKFGNLALEIQ